MTLLGVRALVRLLNTVEPVEELPDATGIAFDSRHVRRGDAFFALPGAVTHGIAFADEALARGAAFVVSDRPHRRGLLVDDANAAILALGRAARERLRVPVVAVSGSAGKTTTKALLAAALAARATPGNLNTHHAIVRALVDAALEDAAAEDAAAEDAALEDASGERGASAKRAASGKQASLDAAPQAAGGGAPRRPLVLELGIDRVGEMAELLELTRPDHAVLTTIAASHTAALGGVEGVAREKSLLLERTAGVRVAGSDAAPHLRPETLAETVVVAAALGAMPSGVRGAAATAVGAAEQHADGTTTLRWRDEGEEGTVLLPWPGRAMAQNALAAVALARRLGVAASVAAERLARARLEPGRLQRSQLGGIILLDDSYNSNPASLAEALAVLRACPPPRVAFLADMLELGGLERESHLRAGELTVGLDLVVAIGPASTALVEANPAALHAPDALAAADRLADVPAGATVLVKGSRSMGMERLVAAIRARAEAGAWSPAAPRTPAGAPC